MTIEYNHDPEFPYLVVNTSGEPCAKYNYRQGAEWLLEAWKGYGRVIDTTPKPKIPEDADYLIWEFNGETGMAYRDGGEWYGAGEWWTAEEMAENLKFAEVTVLVRKEES